MNWLGHSYAKLYANIAKYVRLFDVYHQRVREE